MTTARLTEVLTTLTQTKVLRDKVPPQFVVVTGHEDEVFLFLLHVGDVAATVAILSEVISLAEGNAVVTTLAATRGFIKKRFPIEEAKRIRAELEFVGTSVTFIRPDESP